MMPFIIGDSIGVRMQQQSGFDADAVVGRSPANILDVIRHMTHNSPGMLRGRDVILSSGASNNVREVDLIREQIKLLKQAGANVVLVGVGDRRDYASEKVNKNLASIARSEGIGFTGPLDPVLLCTDCVHPTAKGTVALLSAAAHALHKSGPSPSESGLVRRRHFNKTQLLETQHILAGTATVQEVRDVQRELKAEGFDIGKYGSKHDGVDGIAGRMTRKAITDAMKP